MKTKPNQTTLQHSSIAVLISTTLLCAPGAMRADNLFVANGTANTIEEFNAGGSGTVFANTALNNPNGLAFDTQGNLYVDNYAGNTIEEFTPGGVGSVFANTGLSAPYGMVFDSSGNLYVANAGPSSGYIEKYTPGGVGSVFESGLNYPTGLAINGGNLYVANYLGNSIQKFGLAGGTGSTFAITGLSGPQGIAFDAAGNLYVANFGNGQPNTGTIEKYTPGGIGTVFAGGLNFPDGLAFNSAGDLFASSRNSDVDNLIYEFTPDGTETVFADMGLATPEFIAVQATPEPSTWALLGLGGLICLVYRRRKLSLAGR